MVSVADGLRGSRLVVTKHSAMCGTYASVKGGKRPHRSYNYRPCSKVSLSGFSNTRGRPIDLQIEVS
jgi:hypothetical protein